MQKACIVIPCYNEEKRLSVKKFIEYNHKDIYLLFVNDGSNDLTINVLNKIKEGREDNIYILDSLINKGKSEAVRNGILEAKKWKDFDVIGFLDADLSTSLIEATRLVSLFDNEILFVFGSRIKRVGAEINRKLYRHLLGRFFATLASNMLKIPVYDTQCGAKFFRIDVVELIFSDRFKSNWIFDLEIFYRFSYKYENINSIAKEIPLKKWEDVDGSKIKFKHFIKIPFDLIKLYLYYNKN